MTERGSAPFAHWQNGAVDRHTEARVDLQAIAANVATLAERVAPAGVMAVVKADGYGHGSVAAARAALDGGAARLAVVHVAEALRLRDAGISAPILCMMALPTDPHADAIAADVELSAATPEMIAALDAAAAATGRIARVHLKADTGLSRGGARIDQWPSLVEAALAAPRVEIVALWSHFASSDEPGNPSIGQQQATFEEATEIAQKLGVDAGVLRHLANTAAGITVPSSRHDLVRFGGGIYGLSTLPGGAPGWLRPAMTLTARLIQVKRVPAGSGVSYNHRYLTPAETTLGLVPLGYADGIPRAAMGQPLVWARGRRWPIAGTVCMDQFVVDFGDEPVQVGDEIVLFGPGEDGEPTAQEWGERLGTISYEIATGLGQRVPRVYE
jgi:alanine racemase